MWGLHTQPVDTSAASKATPFTPAEDLTLVFSSPLGSSLGPILLLHSQHSEILRPQLVWLHLEAALENQGILSGLKSLHMGGYWQRTTGIQLCQAPWQPPLCTPISSWSTCCDCPSGWYLGVLGLAGVSQHSLLRAEMLYSKQTLGSGFGCPLLSVRWSWEGSGGPGRGQPLPKQGGTVFWWPTLHRHFLPFFCQLLGKGVF